MRSGTEKRFGPGLCAVAVFVLALTGVFATSAGAAVPTDPIEFDKGTPLEVDDDDADLDTDYWAHVPTSYDETGNTPTTLLVWLHGCWGYSSGDIWITRALGAQSWITVAPADREGGCWDVDSDSAKVLAAIDNAETHFNINPRRVILGGYSSGGDLAYRTAFYNANEFAGVLAENTTPFRDTGSTQAASLAAADWRINVIHLTHNQDTTYPLSVVEPEVGAMAAAGFPVELIKRDGTHYDNENAIVNGHAVPGTSRDLRELLLARIDTDGWLAPEPTPDPDPDPDPVDPDPTDPKPDPEPDPKPDPKPDPAAAPRVTIKAAPNKTTRSRKANFRFRSSVAKSTFLCRIDRLKFRKCSSPKRYRALRNGRHTFRVKATANGKTGPVTRFTWRIPKS